MSSEITAGGDVFSENRAPLIQLQQVSRNDRDTILLNQIDLSIHPGQRIALTGPSGSGKTLLLRSLAMLDPIQSGQVLWQGETVQPVDYPRYRSQVIYLHQRPALVEATVEENLQLPFTMQVHQDKKFDQARIVTMLKQLGRDESFLAKQQRELSGGESQLIALLRVLQLDPAVLLLDEPTAALDQATSMQVEALIDNWYSPNSSQRSIVWVSHNEEQTERVSNTFLSMKDGQLTGDQHG